MRAAVRMVCKAAGVPVVSPYGLRGTYASVTQEEGRAPDTIIKSMGHDSFTTTKGNYIKPEALWAGEQKRFDRAIGPSLTAALDEAGFGTKPLESLVPDVLPIDGPTEKSNEVA